jgi:hypothetical protein
MSTAIGRLGSTVKLSTNLNNTLHRGVVTQLMMHMIELMEQRNQLREDQTTTITPLTSMMKMLRKTGGAI